MTNSGGVRAGSGVRAVLILIGFTAAIAQIVLLRELMAVFCGNEMSIGLMLASWLFWTAAGSSIAGRLRSGPAARPPALPRPRKLLAGVEALTAAVLPCAILAVRASRSVLQSVPGEVLGPGPMLLTSLATLGPLCMLCGALFTAGSSLYAAEAATSAGEATGTVYLWEALGSSAGGILAAVVLVRWLGSFEIVALVSSLNLMAASSLAFRRAAVAAVAGMLALVVFGGGAGRLEEISQERFWRGFHLIATRDSVYGKLAAVGTEGSRSVYENGVVLFNVPDPAAAEEAVHYALLEHPAPRTLLLIGGGLNGSVTEALRHPSLELVDYVELDPAILELAREYFPQEWRAIESDPRVRVHVLDGRLFLKTTESNFDVVIVNLPDPQNAQLNRFYTVEFFQQAARRLTPTGVLSFRLRSSENYISAELGDFLRSIHKSLRSVFPEVTVIPGETADFLAARRPGVLASGPGELLSRLQARQLRTSYVSEYFIPFRMSPDRLREFAVQIQPVATTPLNRDFAPVAYYFDVALWSSQFHQGYRRLFRAMAGVDFGALAAVVAVLLAALAACSRRVRAAAAFCTAATGFTMIGLEMLLLLGFQAVYGYVYQQLAMVIAAFMGGMALGSWLALRSRSGAGIRSLAGVQVLVALAPLVLLSLFQWLTPVTTPVMALACGALGGYEFPLASRIYFSSGRGFFGPGGGVGGLYALDLAGSCLGAVLLAIWFIPVFGFFKTALLLALVSLAPAVRCATQK